MNLPQPNGHALPSGSFRPLRRPPGLALVGVTLPAPKVFGWLPNEAALDRNLTAPELTLLALRVTFASDRKPYALNESKLLSGIRTGKLFKPEGAGRTVVRRTITALARRGYTVRNQAQRLPDGTWAYARETLTAKALATKATGQHIKRAWFDGRWSLNEWAVILFLRSAKTASTSQVAARFGWHRETTSRLVNRLLEAGHLEVKRTKTGRIFKAAVLTAGASQNVGNPVNGHVDNPVNGNVGILVNGNVENPVNTRILRSRYTNPSGKKHAAAAISESGQPADRISKTKNGRLARVQGKELTQDKAGKTKDREQQAAHSQQAGQKEPSDAAFERECQAAIQSLARTMEWFGRHDSHPLGADENLACAKEVLRSAYDRHGADIVGAAERQYVATYCRAEGGPGPYLMEICERLNPRPRREEQQRANSFEACGPAISKLSVALKAAGHSLDGKELIRSAYAKWGKHLACGGADRLADALAGDKPVHSPQALLDAICKRLKEERWKPMGRSRLDELVGDHGPSLW